jgi:hypothetical protein
MPVLLEDDASVEAWLSGSSSSKGVELQPHSHSQDEQQQQQLQQQQGEDGVSSQESEGKAAGGKAAAAKEGKASAFKLVNQVSTQSRALQKTEEAQQEWDHNNELWLCHCALLLSLAADRFAS